MTKRRILLKIEIFVLIFAVILGSVTFIMRYKDDQKRLIPFYDSTKQSLDVIFLGSAHTYSSVIPSELYKKFGFKEDVVRKDYYKNPDNTREDAIVMSLEIRN